MSFEAAGTHDEMGWNETESPRKGMSMLLFVVGGIYWGSVWLLSGLGPLAHLALLRDVKRRHQAG